MISRYCDSKSRNLPLAPHGFLSLFSSGRQGWNFMIKLIAFVARDSEQVPYLRRMRSCCFWKFAAKMLKQPGPLRVAVLPRQLSWHHSTFCYVLQIPDFHVTISFISFLPVPFPSGRVFFNSNIRPLQLVFLIGLCPWVSKGAPP